MQTDNEEMNGGAVALASITLLVFALLCFGWWVPLVNMLSGLVSAFFSQPSADLHQETTIGLGVVAVIAFFGLLSAYATQQEEKAAPVDAPKVSPRAQFKDGSPYGDADLADRETIRTAMNGHNDPSAPIFEE
jgi:hypothetical protein